MSDTGEPDPTELRRLHFLTPWVNSGRMLIVAIGGSVALLRDDPGRVVDAWSYITDQSVVVVAAATTAIAVFGIGGVLTWSFLVWRMTGYAVSGGTLYVRRGVVVKERRQVRLDRLQGVDVAQPLVGRIFGLASLKLEMAAGGEATTTLGLLTLGEAHTLRAELLARSARAPGSDAPERLLLQVPTSRVLASRVLAAGLPLLLLVGYAVVWVVVLAVIRAPLAAWFAALSPVILLLPLFGRTHGRRFLQEANFKLGESADGLRIHSGLITLNHRTIPLRRIQGLHIEVPLIWRWTGWARLTVDVAGSVASSSSDRDNFLPAVNTLVPVAKVAEVRELFSRLADVDLDSVVLSPVPHRARRLDPWAARWEAVGLTDAVAVSRTGSFDRRTAVVPYARIQSVRARQGPLQRRFGLATVHLDGPVGATQWRAPHRDVTDAHELVLQLSVLARSARLAEA